MEHVMKLRPNPFSKIKSGQKTIELRLYDEKRQLISVGDVICFVNTKDETDVLVTEVKALHLNPLMNFTSTCHFYNAATRRKTLVEHCQVIWKSIIPRRNKADTVL